MTADQSVTPPAPTYLAGSSAGATVRDEMATAVQVKEDALPNIRRLKVVKVSPKGVKTECVFADGTSILVSNFLASFIHAGDELLFPLEFAAAAAGTQIYLRKGNPGERRRDVLQAEIGYATRPRKDRRDDLFVSAEVRSPCFGISAINLRCEAIRDYFYVNNRGRAWDRQPSLYQLLRVNPEVSPTELRLAFKLRTLELRTARASVGDLRALERAFNILAHPELRACYDALLNDPDVPALFPYSGFGSLLVAGDRSRDGSTFFALRILSFLPEQRFQHFRIPLRSISFYKDHAIYRDSRRKLEVFFDQTSLPLLWDAGWNQWKHILGAKIGVKAPFIQNGKYQHRGDAWHLVKWETALPSRIEVSLPENIAQQIAEAHETHHRFGQFADILDQIRKQIESMPIERADLQKLCARFGIPGDFDIALITWRPDYDAFYYKQLCKRARRLYLFRSEYIFDLERGVIVETPQLGHATYLFSKPTTMSEFLTIYRDVTKDDIRHNRGNVAERLGFLSRLIHTHNPAKWERELKICLGEVVDYAAAEEVSD